ncbi:MAG: DNA-3-methyladenine glycosylase II [Planctomycetota bacterium]
MSPAPIKPTPAQLRALVRRDPKLGRAIKRLDPYPGFPQQGKYQSHFHALAHAIVYQQLAGRAAETIHGRVLRLTPGSRFPNAEQLQELSERELRGAGLSNNKFLALRDLSDHVLDGRLRLRALANRSDEEVIEALVEVRGIGVWSAQMFLMFRLGRQDVLPIGDLGVQEGLRRLDGLAERPKPKELEARGAAWAPLRSLAAWTLWRLADEKA